MADIANLDTLNRPQLKGTNKMTSRERVNMVLFQGPDRVPMTFRKSGVRTYFSRDRKNLLTETVSQQRDAVEDEWPDWEKLPGDKTMGR